MMGFVAVGVWVVVGPLQPGWARAAGTPAALTTASDGVGDGSTSPSPPTTSVFAAPFSSTFSGTVVRQVGQEGTETLELQAPLSGSTAMVLDVRLVGRPVDNGLALRSGTVGLGTTTGPASYRGDVTGLRGGRVTATVTDAVGHRLALTIVVNVGNSIVSGVVNAVPAGAAADAGDAGQ
ncbi:MAG: hypothetical protein JO265_02245 [Acidimicrobiia bacterium]|nr:hypothetical protein [Acidimicrobiia bacterium]